MVAAPTAGIDPRSALAAAIQSAPGVYAVLLGSGVSSAAGVPTGWNVVQDLIRRVALADGVDPDKLGDQPEVWWAAEGRPEPRYDTLVGALAPTDAARQALLREYFDPPPGKGGALVPTAAHAALAELCAAGRVRVIVTTNFDRLIERALDAAGVSPQVIASPSAVAGMIPLAHAPSTVIKLHGDYLTLGMRNTPDEVGTYPSEWKKLLAQILDEYGLLVVGWSAEYDVALGDEILTSPSRRYPMYWASFQGDLTEPARRLIAQRQAIAIDTAGADEFLTDVVQRVERLDRVAQRRRQPTPLRAYAYPPEQTTAPQGWAVLPLLQLRAVATVGPASLDTCGIIRASHRHALINALRIAPLTTRLYGFSGYKTASASADSGGEVMPTPLSEWRPTPGGHQSTESLSYRMGGDANRGVSALLTARFPGYGVTSHAVFTVDLGLSLESRVRLGEAAALLRDSLLLATALLPDVLAEALPADAHVDHAEVHIFAAATDGNQHNRPNDLVQRLDLSALGEPTRAVGPLLGFAARLGGPLAEREAAALVANAIEYMALASGYLDPGFGVTLLRQELGLASS